MRKTEGWARGGVADRQKNRASWKGPQGIVGVLEGGDDGDQWGLLSVTPTEGRMGPNGAKRGQISIFRESFIFEIIIWTLLFKGKMSGRCVKWPPALIVIYSLFLLCVLSYICSSGVFSWLIFYFYFIFSIQEKCEPSFQEFCSTLVIVSFLILFYSCFFSSLLVVEWELKIRFSLFVWQLHLHQFVQHI